MKCIIRSICRQAESLKTTNIDGNTDYSENFAIFWNLLNQKR